MESNNNASKPKPRVAYANQAAAEQNIQTKLSLMAAALRIDISEIAEINPIETKVGEQIFSLIPKSVRQFNLWNNLSLPTPLQDLVPTFSKNSHSTLIKLRRLHDAVNIAVKAAKHAVVTTIPASKEDNIARLKRSLALANSLRAMVEIELIRLKNQSISQKSQIEILELKLNELERRTRQSI
ncbi:hypothetical protein HUU62_22345 [Rhodoferax sp. 4810]|nr:hypothetical protein [Rhodoferax jenense]